jgi:hypothetical protein
MKEALAVFLATLFVVIVTFAIVETAKRVRKN